MQLGHLKCDHGVWLTVGNVLANGTIRILPVMSDAIEEGLFRWMRAAELTCDRCASCAKELVNCGACMMHEHIDVKQRPMLKRWKGQRHYCCIGIV